MRDPYADYGEEPDIEPSDPLDDVTPSDDDYFSDRNADRAERF